MGKLEVDISAVKKLVELVETYHLEELTVEEADLSITVKGHAAQSAAPIVMHTGVQQMHQDVVHEPEELSIEAEEAPQEELVDLSVVDITSPLVGVFYRSPSPDAGPFVVPGDKIEIGTEVGLIEAMKVFSPIPSEIAGEVVEIVADNGKLVQMGDVLIKVRVTQE